MKKACLKSLKIDYGQIDADPKEIEMRVSNAFEVLFDEVVKTSQQSGLKEIYKKYEINRTKV